ncbi:MAG: hypothetical protein KKE17_05735 [Proteobacteria bacterium]|nr:hypothetical protein [Pseudomonadota bacterium]
MLRKITSLKLALMLVLTMAATSWADVPPPPVNQNIGIPDGVFNNLEETNCRVCHEDPNGTIPDRHHLLVGTGPLPNPTAAPNGASGDPAYECLTCHNLMWDPNTSTYQLVAFRDCLLCHEQIAGGASVHHLTAAAKQDDCKACHGPIDNPNDGHYIPTYNPSLVTPRTGTGTGSNGEGGCEFCHDSGIDGATGTDVKTNGETHHGTGLFLDSTKCVLCHDPLAKENARIRRCEKCHGVASLHNIQYDSDNSTNLNQIVPGGENAYWGHIGHNDDCWGCHGFTAMSSAPYSGPVVPDVSSLSSSNIIEGKSVRLTLEGAGFTNTVQGPSGPIQLTSAVRLTASDDSTVTVNPVVISTTSLEFMTPADLAPGNWGVQVVKADKTSNTVNLSVVPNVTIDSVACSDGVVSITGSGFSMYVDAVNSGTDLNMQTKIGKRKRTVTVSRKCSVETWTDSLIEADCGRCGSSVLVDSIFGTDSETLPTTDRRSR